VFKNLHILLTEIITSIKMVVWKTSRENFFPLGDLHFYKNLKWSIIPYSVTKRA